MSENVPPLREPIALAAFEGWNDAGDAASGVIAHLKSVWDVQPLAALDPEEYHDFQVNRPTVSVVNGKRRITWPTTRLYWARPAGSTRDIILIQGIEPSTRWRRYTKELLAHLTGQGASTLITLGALLADVPHTRPIPVTTTSEDVELLARLALQPSTYEGPTGIVGVLSEAAEVPSEKIRRGDMTEEEFRRFVESAVSLQNAPLFIDDTPALPINQLAARARKLKRTRGLDVLIVDYLQLLRPATAKDSRVNEVSEITQGLKAIAKELNIPVIALSQLSRQVENRDDKRPQLSDLRESGSIEQDADVVMFVFREEYYREREKPADHELDKMAQWQEIMASVHGKAEVILGKQRHGPIGTVELSFEGQFTRFGNLERHRSSEWG